jgi:hypothetical protein
MDQNRIGGVIHQLNKSGFGEHIYCVLCGRMTADQRRIVRERSKVDTQLFIDIMTWFVQKSGHPGFNNTSIPHECPQPLLVEDKETTNNTDYSLGILGTVLAFFAADEEQGRKTLHHHWQIWVKEIDKILRNCLFHEDDTIRNIARKTFYKQIENVITASYGPEFRITHKCVNKKNDLVNKQDMAEVIFQEQDPYIF